MPKDATDMKQAMMMMGDCVLGAAVLIVVGVFAGSWLDSRLHSAPLWTVALSLLGAGLGLARLVIKALKLEHTGGSRSDSLPPSDTAGAADQSTASSANANTKPDDADDTSLKSKRKPAQPPRSAFDFLNQEDSGKRD